MQGINPAGWQHGYKWTTDGDGMEPPEITCTDKGGKHPGFDYMLAYNILWLDCLQKGIKSDFIQDLAYANGSDEYFVFGKLPLCKIFNFTNNLNIYNFNTGFMAAKGFETLEIEAPEIQLSSAIDFEVGYTVNITPGPKLSDCDIENFLNQ